MSKFRIGQKARVKYVRTVCAPSWRVGAVVTVVGDVGDVGGISPWGNPFDYEVMCADGHTAFPLAEQLEPIVPPHEASQYSYTELMDRCRAGEVECV